MVGQHGVMDILAMFYTESNNFATYTVNAIANDGTTTGPISINGNSGAKFIGFYTTGSQCLLKSITITYPPAANGFAIGEFGISYWLLQE